MTFHRDSENERWFSRSRTDFPVQHLERLQPLRFGHRSHQRRAVLGLAVEGSSRLPAKRASRATSATAPIAGERPRDSRVDHAVSRAVHELPAEAGYSAVTMDAVAAPLFIAEMADNPNLSTRFRNTLMAAELTDATEILELAQARYELAGRPDGKHVHSLMLGSVFAWLFMLRHEPPPPGLADELADLIVHGLRATPSAPTAPG